MIAKYPTSAPMGVTRPMAPTLAAQSELAALREELAKYKLAVERLGGTVEKVAGVAKDNKDCAEDLKQRLADAERRNAEFRGLIEEFCQRVECGEVRSKATYAKFKAALAQEAGPVVERQEPVETIERIKGLRHGPTQMGHLFDTESVELLPCPFCGGPAVKIMWMPEGVQNGECCCPDEDCAGSAVECPYENWNTRFEPEPAPLSPDHSGGAMMVVLPERSEPVVTGSISDFAKFEEARGWNACLDKVKELNQ